MNKINFEEFQKLYITFLNNIKLNNIYFNDLLQDLSLSKKRRKINEDKNNDLVLCNNEVIFNNIEDERINNTKSIITFDNISNDFNETIYYKLIKLQNTDNKVYTLNNIYGYIDYFINTILKHYYLKYENGNNRFRFIINIRKHIKEGIKILYADDLLLSYNFNEFFKVNYTNIYNEEEKKLLMDYFNKRFIINNSKLLYNNKEIPTFNFNYKYYLSINNIDKLKNYVKFFDKDMDICIFFKDISNILKEQFINDIKNEHIIYINNYINNIVGVDIIKNKKIINKDEKNIEQKQEQKQEQEKENNKKDEKDIFNDKDIYKYFIIRGLRFINKEEKEKNKNKTDEEKQNDEKNFQEEMNKKNLFEAKLMKQFNKEYIGFRYIIEQEVKKLLNNSLVKMDLMYYYIKKNQIIKKYTEALNNNFINYYYFTEKKLNEIKNKIKNK